MPRPPSSNISMWEMNLFERIFHYGDQIETVLTMGDPDEFVEWTENNFDYAQYNPGKPINRQGLSITSLDGSVSGHPGLGSLTEHNFENNTHLTEATFSVKTPVYDHVGLQEIIAPWKDSIYRSHVLRLGPGGFFLPHRDGCSLNPRSLRLIVPLKNFSAPDVVFLQENRVLKWKPGILYFVNTFKVHTLFNASMSPSYWIVFNVPASEESAEKVLMHMRYR